MSNMARNCDCPYERHTSPEFTKLVENKGTNAVEGEHHSRGGDDGRDVGAVSRMDSDRPAAAIGGVCAGLSDHDA